MHVFIDVKENHPDSLLLYKTKEADWEFFWVLFSCGFFGSGGFCVCVVVGFS